MNLQTILRNLPSDFPKERQKYKEYESFDHAANDAARTHDCFQPKYDGIWAMCVLVGGKCYVYSRNHKLKAILLTQTDMEKEPTVVLGEYMFGSQWAQDPERRGRIYVFDCLWRPGEARLYLQNYGFRYKHACAVVDACPDLFSPVPCFRMSAFGPIFGHNLGKPRAQRFEGFVLRQWGDHYRDTLYKLKYDVEDDFVVMRVNPGAGKHEGRMGSLTVGQYKDGVLVEIMNVGGGFTDEGRMRWQRLAGEIATRDKQFVITVTGKKRFDDGTFRHPNYLRTRDDKNPLECTFPDED